MTSIDATGLSVESQLRTLLMAGMAPLLGYLADRYSGGVAVLVLAACGLAFLPLLRVARSSGAPRVT